MTAHILTAPIPPYQNVPITAQYYTPSRFVISGVTLGLTTIITTTVNLNYAIGQLVRLIIPPSFGCRQLNGQTGYVLSLPTTNSVEVSISSVGFDPYFASSATTQAQILAIGDVNNGYQALNGLTGITPAIPGSFINISPL